MSGLYRLANTAVSSLAQRPEREGEARMRSQGRASPPSAWGPGAGARCRFASCKVCVQGMRVRGALSYTVFPSASGPCQARPFGLVPPSSDSFKRPSPFSPSSTEQQPRSLAIRPILRPGPERSLERLQRPGRDARERCRIRAAFVVIAFAAGGRRRSTRCDALDAKAECTRAGALARGRLRAGVLQLRRGILLLFTARRGRG